MQWYFAHSTGADRWELGGDSRAAAIAEGRAAFGSSDFAIASERVDTDEEFFEALVEALQFTEDLVDEELVELGFIDPEDPYFSTVEVRVREILKKALLEGRELARPKWRTIENAEAIPGVFHD